MGTGPGAAKLSRSLADAGREEEEATLFVPLSFIVGLVTPSKTTEDLRTALMRSLPRRAILEVIEKSPGIPLSILITRLPYGSGTIYHHLQVLERSGLVTTVAAGRRRLAFPIGAIQEEADDTRHLVLLGAPATRKIAQVIVDNPGCSVAEIVLKTRESPRIVYYNLKQLLDAGLVVSASDKRYRKLTATPSLESVLQRVERMLSRSDDEPGRS